MKTFVSFVAPNQDVAVSVEIADKESGERIANFLEYFYNVKSMISQGETYEESEAVYLAGYSKD